MIKADASLAMALYVHDGEIVYEAVALVDGDDFKRWEHSVKWGIGRSRGSALAEGGFDLLYPQGYSSLIG